MGYDVMANGAPAAAAAAAPRDIAGAGAGKKKRANRSAKLKQCKLDARREQWLSQVKNDSKGASMSVSPTSPLMPPPLSLPRARMGRGALGTRPKEEEGVHMSIHDSSDSESPSHSPTSSSSGHASTKCEFEEEDATDTGTENGLLDDWEAVADALSIGNDRSDSNLDSSASVVNIVSGSQREAPGRATVKPEPICPPPRAWRPDDRSRPLSLPSLSKQRGFALEIERQCGSARTLDILCSRSSCPICCEELDVTDSTFLPCSCGFHLCLFCHKRILEEDGRCPGCRKQYSQIADVGGGDSSATMKLSRSCSMSA